MKNSFLKKSRGFWIFLIGYFLLTSVLWPQEGQISVKPSLSSQTVNWEADVQKIIKSSFSVSKSKLFKDEVVIISIDKPKETSDIDTSDSLIHSIYNVLMKKGSLIVPLTTYKLSQTFINTFEGLKSSSYCYSDNGELNGLILTFRQSPIKEEELDAIKNKYFFQFITDPITLRILMPELHAVLAAAERSCPDCPGPSEVPSSRQITFDELVHYAVAFHRPVSVLKDKVMMEDISLDEYHFENSSPELDIAIAAQLCMSTDYSIDFAIQNTIWQAFHDKVYKKGQKTMTDTEKVEFMRTYLKNQLPKNVKFISYLRAKAEEICPQLGLELIESLH